MPRSRRPLLRSKAITITENTSKVSQKRVSFSSYSSEGITATGDSCCSYLGIDGGVIMSCSDCPGRRLERTLRRCIPRGSLGDPPRLPLANVPDGGWGVEHQKFRSSVSFAVLMLYRPTVTELCSDTSYLVVEACDRDTVVVPFNVTTRNLCLCQLRLSRFT